MTLLDTPLMTWRCAADSRSSLRVVRAVVNEALNQPWRAEIELVQAATDRAIDSADLLGAAGSLVFDRARGHARTFHGLVTACTDQESGRSWRRLHLTLTAAPGVLALRSRSRVVLGLDAPAILRDALDAHPATRGLRLEHDLRESGPQRDQTVQWREDDLAFAARQLEHEGITWWLRDDGTVMLTDHPGGFVQLDGGPLPLQDVGEDALPVHDRKRTCAVWTWKRRLSLGPGAAVVRDWNWRNPDLPLDQQATTPAEDAVAADEEYGSHHEDGAGGRRYARLRAEALACRRETWHGSADDPRLGAGRILRLQRPSDVDGPSRWLVTAARHEASQQLERGSGSGGDATTYHCTLTAHPADRTWRPALTTPRPTIPGVINAVIDGAGGGKFAEPDDHGCYRVKAAFDRSERGHGNASQAVRLATAYSGPDHGLHLPLHPGAEVLLSHVNGDPDRPVISAAVPGGRNPSVVTSSNRTQCVLRSAGGNELILDDSPGTEVWSESATRDRRLQVGGDDDLRTAGNRTGVIGGSETLAVAGDLSITVGRAASETITGAKALSVGAALQISVGGVHNTTVGGAMAEQVGAAHSSVVAGNRSAAVGGDDALTVTGDHTERAVGKRHITCKKLLVSASDELTIACGKASLVMKSDGTVVIKGTRISVSGSGAVTIKGSKLAGN
jgi:type VI secretion system secreted protein VgrG